MHKITKAGLLVAPRLNSLAARSDMGTQWQDFCWQAFLGLAQHSALCLLHLASWPCDRLQTIIKILAAVINLCPRTEQILFGMQSRLL